MNIKDLRALAKDDGLTGEVRLLMTAQELEHYIDSGEKPLDSNLFRRAAGKARSKKRRDELLAKADAAGAAPDTPDTPAPDTPAPEDTTDSSVTNAATAFAAALQQQNTVDEKRVKELINVAMEDLTTVTVTVDRKNREVGHVEGLRHKQFSTTLNAITAGVNPILIGPTGSGKSYLAGQIASALGLEFEVQSMSPETGAHDIVGYYEHGTGKFRSTPFFRAYTEGGVYLMDEVDAAPPDITLLVNNALNGTYIFPCGKRKKHKDFIIIAAGNTIAGATENYNGREKQDAAFLNRFFKIDVNYDVDFERKLLGEAISNMLKELRKISKKNGYDIPVSTRSGIQIKKLTAAGFTTTEAIAGTVLGPVVDDEIKEKFQRAV